jgi:hypothetical protein
MTTNQQYADRALALWQSRRDLTPEERMEILFGDVLRSNLLSWDEYQADVRTVGEIMEAS